MCKKCGKNSCSGSCQKTSSNQEIANLQAQLAETADQLNALLDNAQWLLTGHPILAVEQADDIALFDLTTGLGQDAWLGWAVCDGQTHYSANAKKNISTPNFTDRFLVQAGGEYAVGDTGGSDTVILTTPQLPAHNHSVTDPGHDHVVTDPGHNHAVTDPGHTHTQNAHTHTYTDSAATQPGYYLQPTPSTYAAINTTNTNTTDATTAVNQTNTTGISVNTHATGVSVNTNTTGVTTNNTGAGDAHENRPPYFAVIYIIKL